MSLDPELIPFLGGPATSDLNDIDGSRALARTLTVQAVTQRAPVPAQLRIDDRVAVGEDGRQVRVRVYQPVDQSRRHGALLFVHGGAFIFGDLELEHDRCLYYATHTDVVVVAPDYRLAPEFPYPAGLEDVELVARWIVTHADELGIDPQRIGVGGASAGGALAAGLVLRRVAQGGAPFAAQMLIYPVLDDRATTRSMSAFEDYDPWDGRRSRQMWPIYLGHSGDAPVDAAPARAEDLGALPVTFIMSCEEDPLRDEDLSFAQRLLHAGVSVELHHYRGTYHAFDVIAPDAAVSRRALDEQALFIQRVLG